MTGIDKIIKNVSQRELARRLGIRYQSVQDWIAQGYVPLERVRVLSQMFDVSWKELINPKLLNAFGGFKDREQNNG